jgi:hypothetical protein
MGRFWNAEFARADKAMRLFRLLRNPKHPTYLVRDDFRPIVQGLRRASNCLATCSQLSPFPPFCAAEIVNRHPGLEFLETTPEFQLRYGIRSLTHFDRD